VNAAEAAMIDRPFPIPLKSKAQPADAIRAAIRNAATVQGTVTSRNRRFRLLCAVDAHPSVEDAARREGRDHRLQRLEAVLFLSREPLTTRKLSQYANLADGTEARTLVGRLNDLYDNERRSFRVERVAGGYQILTRPQFASWVRRLEHIPRETRLSAPASETLAVVAYRQPVLRADVEAIRGVNCGEILRQLMERDLVRISGRSEDLGRPYLYSTTKRFLHMFGLDSLEALPRVEALRRSESEPLVEQRENEAVGSRSAKDGETGVAQKEEDSTMPQGMLSGWDRKETLTQLPPDDLLAPQVTAFDEEEDYDEVYDEGEDGDDEDYEDEEEEEDEDDFEEYEEDDEDYDDEDEDEDFEDDDEWEEVDDEDEDDDDWEDDDSEWDEDLDEDEDEDDDWE
jgi:segregation and condensation protein B